jgi:hypothetical protein
MKQLLLNCDQVFDALTRGPFPSGDASDEGVELHLRACHECRQLAEALRPAVELLHESIDRDQAHDLPAYQGLLPCNQADLDVRQALRPVRAVPSHGRHGRRPFEHTVSAVRFIAASLLLAALGIMGYGLAVSPPTAHTTSEFGGLLTADRGPAHLPDGPGLLTLASLKLPPRCLPPSYQQLSAEQATALAAAMAAGSADALRCCTECHAAERMQPAKPGLVAVAAQACSHCHRG